MCIIFDTKDSSSPNKDYFGGRGLKLHPGKALECGACFYHRASLDSGSNIQFRFPPLLTRAAARHVCVSVYVSYLIHRVRPLETNAALVAEYLNCNLTKDLECGAYLYHGASLGFWF